MSPWPPFLGAPLPAHAERLAARRARGHLQGDRAVQRGHLDVRAERRLRIGDRQVDGQVVALAAEQRRAARPCTRTYRSPGCPPRRPGLAASGQLDPRAVLTPAGSSPGTSASVAPPPTRGTSGTGARSMRPLPRHRGTVRAIEKIPWFTATCRRRRSRDTRCGLVPGSAPDPRDTWHTAGPLICTGTRRPGHRLLERDRDLGLQVGSRARPLLRRRPATAAPPNSPPNRSSRHVADLEPSGYRHAARASDRPPAAPPGRPPGRSPQRPSRGPRRSCRASPASPSTS